MAVPVLLRRIAERVAPDTPVEIPRPIRVKRNRIVRAQELERAVGLAARLAGPDGSILILIDADDDCPANLAPDLLRRAEHSRSDRSISVVVARSEYESWFLAAASSLAGYRGIDERVSPPADPESIRGAKEWLRERMPRGQRYRENPSPGQFHGAIRSGRRTVGPLVRQDVARRAYVAGWNRRVGSVARTDCRSTRLKESSHPGRISRCRAHPARIPAMRPPRARRRAPGTSRAPPPRAGLRCRPRSARTRG